MRDIRDFSLKEYNTFGIDARCRRFLEFDNETELQEILAAMTQEERARVMVVGGGSNLLLTADYDGTVVHPATKGITYKPDDGGVEVRAAAGETWDDVVADSILHGCYGAENLSLIPGQVGAAAVQNIGAYGVEVASLIRTVEAVELKTGKPYVFTSEDCAYGYRTSRFKKEWRGRFVITHVCFFLSTVFEPKLDYGNIRQALDERHIQQPTATELRDVIIAIRQSKLPDPKVTGNAGSFFMNPVVDRKLFGLIRAKYPDVPSFAVGEDEVKIPAGWLIEQCGWKGRALGRAAVHDRQALVLVNKGGATGEEILSLSRTVQEEVFRRFGVVITPEVNIV